MGNTYRNAPTLIARYQIATNQSLGKHRRRSGDQAHFKHSNIMYSSRVVRTQQTRRQLTVGRGSSAESAEVVVRSRRRQHYPCSPRAKLYLRIPQAGLAHRLVHRRLPIAHRAVAGEVVRVDCAARLPARRCPACACRCGRLRAAAQRQGKRQPRALLRQRPLHAAHGIVPPTAVDADKRQDSLKRRDNLCRRLDSWWTGTCTNFDESTAGIRLKTSGLGPPRRHNSQTAARLLQYVA